MLGRVIGILSRSSSSTDQVTAAISTRGTIHLHRVAALFRHWCMYLSHGEDCIHNPKVVLITQRCFHSCTTALFLVGRHPRCVGAAHVCARTGGAAVQTAGEGFVLLLVNFSIHYVPLLLVRYQRRSDPRDCALRT